MEWFDLTDLPQLQSVTLNWAFYDVQSAVFESDRMDGLIIQICLNYNPFNLMIMLLLVMMMIIEGYLHQSNTTSILSRITDPIFSKLAASPLNSVNEGRSIHPSAYSISLRIVNVFL